MGLPERPDAPDQADLGDDPTQPAGDEPSTEEAAEADSADSPTDPAGLSFADLGLDLIVDYAGFGNTTVDAISVVRNGGTVVLVGMGRLEATINTRTLITNKTTLIGSNGGDPEDIAGVY